MSGQIVKPISGTFSWRPYK